MYTILINDNNTLTKSVITRIMHRSNMVDQIHFLTNPTYNDLDMTEFMVTMQYRTPVSHTYRVVNLIRSEELYKDMLEYKLPVDTKITAEAGDVEITFVFTKFELQPDGTQVKRVRNTDTTTITVLPVTAWDDQIGDVDLSNIATIMLETQRQISQVADMQAQQMENQASDIVLDVDNEEVYLINPDGAKIGHGYTLNDLGDAVAEATEEGLVTVLI